MNSTPPADAPASLVAPAPASLRPERGRSTISSPPASRRLEPPILQPASVFLDMSGEDIRGRLYLATDAAGAELCLRPDYTVPVCLAYLASPEAGRPAQYAYLGPVFRARPGQSGERPRPVWKAMDAPTSKPPTRKSSGWRSKRPSSPAPAR